MALAYSFDIIGYYSRNYHRRNYYSRCFCACHCSCSCTPSFRFHLAMDTLGVQLYPSHYRAGSGLSPFRFCPCRAHNDHLWEGKYSPRDAHSKRISRNVYAKTREECEAKLAVMIEEVRKQIAEEKERMKVQK